MRNPQFYVRGSWYRDGQRRSRAPIWIWINQAVAQCYQNRTVSNIGQICAWMYMSVYLLMFKAMFMNTYIYVYPYWFCNNTMFVVLSQWINYLMSSIILDAENQAHIGKATALMMTSSNGNIFRVIGPLCGEFTGLRWRWALIFSLICVWINGWVNNRETGDLRRYRAHYDVSVMRFHAVKFRWYAQHANF